MWLCVINVQCRSFMKPFTSHKRKTNINKNEKKTTTTAMNDEAEVVEDGGEEKKTFLIST